MKKTSNSRITRIKGITTRAEAEKIMRSMHRSGRRARVDKMGKKVNEEYGVPKTAQLYMVTYRREPDIYRP